MDEKTHTPAGEPVRTPTVSVIIPAYKVARFIAETIDSVLAQTFTSYEVIVINDGTPDVDELEQSLSPYRRHIIYVSQKNQGAGAARNAGLRLAQGEFVAFLDGDDVWLPEFLAEQVALISSNGGYDLVYADAVNFGNSASSGRNSMATNPSLGEVTFESLITGKCNVITSAVVARRGVILNVGLFDQSFPNSQDFDLWLRLVREGKARITYQNKVLVRRRIYKGSLASDSVKSFGGEIGVLKKVLRRTDLSESERAIIQQTISRRDATAKVILAKRSLSAANYAEAARLFEAANETHYSWKLQFVLFSLKLAPRLLRFVLHTWFDCE